MELKTTADDERLTRANAANNIPETAKSKPSYGEFSDMYECRNKS